MTQTAGLNGLTEASLKNLQLHEFINKQINELTLRVPEWKLAKRHSSDRTRSSSPLKQA